MIGPHSPSPDGHKPHREHGRRQTGGWPVPLWLTRLPAPGGVQQAPAVVSTALPPQGYLVCYCNTQNTEALSYKNEGAFD